MYFDYEVKIPDSRHGLTRKKIRGITYIYYAYDHKYSLDKHYTIPKNTTIGSAWMFHQRRCILIPTS